MESLKSFHEHLENLQHQARILTSTGLSLITLFAGETNRLSREDEASRLIALYSSIRQRLERVKRNEDSASYGHSQANLMLSLGRLAASGVLGMVSENRQLSTMSGYLLQGLGNKQRPFGKVLVCIGPKGLPDDLRVVSISRLARESNQDEPEVVNELQERGYLPFNEKEFSLLIGKLIDNILKGRLRLPIPKEKLTEVKT
jgi:hypothetical protein